MLFEYQGKPIAKARHRMFRNIAYDPQSKLKNKIIKEFASQFQREGHLKPLEGAIAATVDIRHPIPVSWSKKRKIERLGKYVTSKPDVDNICKFALDVLNKIAYHDDAQISSLITQKIYSDNPGVTITLEPINEAFMIDEHAITYKDKLSQNDIDYLIKKANRLGLAGRQIAHVYEREENTEKHIYFAVEGIKEK